jgi:hypothetical protein
VAKTGFYSIIVAIGSVRRRRTMQLHLSFVLAYLDPGSGSFIIQIVIAALLGGGLMVKTFWHQIVGLFRRDVVSSHEDESQDQ